MKYYYLKKIINIDQTFPKKILFIKTRQIVNINYYSLYY